MANELLELNLANLKELDSGKAFAAFQTALNRAIRDCVDRPGDERARKVILQLTITPTKEVVDNLITCEGAHGTFQIRCKLPDWETDICDFGVKQNGMAYFNADSPRNHRQLAMDLDGDDGE